MTLHLAQAVDYIKISCRLQPAVQYDLATPLIAGSLLTARVCLQKHSIACKTQFA